MQYALSVPEGTKFDFQNIDVKLYLALKAVIHLAEAEVESLIQLGKQDPDTKVEADHAQSLFDQAVLALAEFELSHGPLPEWAIGRNWDYSLQPGAQLMTKDGRRTGNAHILRSRMWKSAEKGNFMIYECITDAGSYISGLSESELENQYWVGDYISDPKTLIARFGNHGEDYGLPQQGDPDVS